jgi:hypothetical protein
MAVLPDSLSDGKQTLLSKLTAACPEMTSLAALVCSFAGLLTPAPANEAALKDWAEAARACDLPNMHAFTRGLDLDIRCTAAPGSLSCATASCSADATIRHHRKCDRAVTGTVPIAEYLLLSRCGLTLHRLQISQFWCGGLPEPCRRLRRVDR